ncbi:hypothetical protein AZI86_07850 [Bdellovibrio bacteriovorus]|uniref:Uncharacterized protein n=1 Tax=Bdellovibrio bacteriovorus TaxID=959 RepID=A0A150WR80_BDEBC|nr:hypothetical protein [Bdellovibrio bacteriovorus]KYG66930.1 hypothetical protein AZI86_07850 [Bdellovibrio bacteriovorus]
MKTLKTSLAVFLAVTQLSQTAQAGLFDIFKPQPKPVPTRPQPPLKETMATINSKGRYQNLSQWGQWNIISTRWTAEDEQGFSDFVQAIGRSDCRTVEDCIFNPANPFYGGDPGPELYKFWSDCADWPYFLRSYYAWKNGLPFMFSQGMRAVPLTPEQQAAVDAGTAKAQTDIRYSANGNVPLRQVRIPHPTLGSNFFEIQDIIQDSIATSTLRVDPRTDFGDTYTPAIRHGAIRPGTIVYDPSGHTGVVYDVTDDGEVMVFDAFSDKKSVSKRRPYSSDRYTRSRITHGGWFQNFRPVVIEGAQFDRRTGTYVGGVLRALKNSEIADYSTEMFGNTTTADGKSAYLVETASGYKVTTSFQEFLKRRLYLNGTYSVDVLREFKNKMTEVCDDFQARASGVQEATTLGIAAQPHVAVLPNTIYGGDGVWETHSTPGGDVRRRGLVRTALKSAKELVAMVKSGNPDYSYYSTVEDLKEDLIAIAENTVKTCSVTYTNTAGRPVTLTLEEMLRRAPLMSFSPWHCIELRWGASSPQELRSCPDINDPVKMRWYKAQQTMRNQMDRDTNIFTGFTLEGLEQNASKIGPVDAPNLNLVEIFKKEL